MTAVHSGYVGYQDDGSMYIEGMDDEGTHIVELGSNLFFVVDGEIMKNGLHELDGEYYYATASTGALVVNATVWVSLPNDLLPDGKGYYAFDAEGKLIKSGFAVCSDGSAYYYDDLVRAKGLTQIGEDYYFFNVSSGRMYQNTTLWVGGNNPYGLPSGYYEFGADGKMCYTAE